MNLVNYIKDKTVNEVGQNKEKYIQFLKIAWPCIVEMILLYLAHLIDTLMVSSLGENAVAAVGIVGNPRIILLAVITSLNAGVTAVVARRKGENRQSDANMLLKAVLVIGVGLSIVISVVSFFAAQDIITFMGAQQSYIDDAVLYFKILSIGLFFQSLKLIVNSAQRGCGNTKVSMITNVTVNVVNVILNYLLIFGNFGFPKLGVAGAAIATTCGIITGFIIAVVSLFKKGNYLSVSIMAKQKLDFTVLKPVLKISSSAFVEQVFLRIGFLIYGMIVIRLGTTAYATHLLCTNLSNISVCIAEGLGIAATTLVGQQLGAKSVKGAVVYGKVGQNIAAAASFIIFCAFFFFRHPIMGAFSKDEVIISMGANVLVITACISFFQTSQLIYYSCLRGAGDARYVAVMSLISVAIIRPILTFVLCLFTPLALYGAWIAVLVDQVARRTMAKRRFNSGKWSEIVL